MTQQVICDGCGEPIDTNQPYYSVSSISQKVVDTMPTVVASGQFDFHAEHVPGKIAVEQKMPEPESASGTDVPVWAESEEEQ